MRNVFLDLGTHFGQGLRSYIARFNMDESWQIHTFEANPITYQIYQEKFHEYTPWVHHYNTAICHYDGFIDINVESFDNGDKTGQGSSVISRDEWDPWGNGKSDEHFKESISVPCIDLSNFILSKFDKEDNIIVKMDIEGSEYDVLEKMIADGSIHYINHIDIEWHSRYFTNKEEILSREAKLLAELNKCELALGTWV